MAHQKGACLITALRLYPENLSYVRIVSRKLGMCMVMVGRVGRDYTRRRTMWNNETILAYGSKRRLFAWNVIEFKRELLRWAASGNWNKVDSPFYSECNGKASNLRIKFLQLSMKFSTESLSAASLSCHVSLRTWIKWLGIRRYSVSFGDRKT